MKGTLLRSSMNTEDRWILSGYEEGLSHTQIAETLKCSQSWVSKRLKHYGYAGRNYNFSKPLTQHQRSVLLGTLLGDASLSLPPRCRNAGLYLGHGKKQREYLIWKAEQLPALFNTYTPHVHVYPDGNEKHSLQSRKHPVLTEYYRRMYRGSREPGLNGKKITSDVLSEVDDLALAVWWADDGGKTRRRLDGSYDLYLTIGGVTEPEYALFHSWFAAYGFESYRVRDRQSNCSKYVLHIEGSRRLAALLRTHLPPCISWKLEGDASDFVSRRKKRVPRDGTVVNEGDVVED